MTTASGLVVVDKPSGVTSHHVVGRLRRLLGTRKVGHAGTLDPMATGVLVLGVNRATRLLGHLALHDKRYIAVVRLGASSDTDDADGVVVPVADASGLAMADVEAACLPLRGRIEQVPSSVSAIKVNGKRAYQLHREGQPVELRSRVVEVSRLDVTPIGAGERTLDIQIDVECSSGTYIRALARDLGAALGVGGHLVALRRTRVGGFGLADAVVLGDEPPAMMSMAEAARRSFACVDLTAEQARDVHFGRALDRGVPADPTGVVSPTGDLLALYRPDGAGSRPVSVLVSKEDL